VLHGAMQTAAIEGRGVVALSPARAKARGLCCHFA
jgi:hypothetical protein